MKTSDFIVALLQAMCSILVRSMRHIEDSSEKDPDGVPISDEWAKESFLLASLRVFVTSYENAIKEYNYEK